MDKLSPITYGAAVAAAEEILANASGVTDEVIAAKTNSAIKSYLAETYDYELTGEKGNNIVAINGTKYKLSANASYSSIVINLEAIEAGAEITVNNIYYSNPYALSYVFADDDMVIIEKPTGIENNTKFESITLTVPEGATTLVLGNNSKIMYPSATAKKQRDRYVNNDGVNELVDTTVTRKTNELKQNNVSLMLKNVEISARNVFDYKEMDKAYVIIVLDDCYTDQTDLVASICETKGIPLNVSYPGYTDGTFTKTTFNQVCTGLSTATGSYIKGMTLLSVIQKIQELGGEVLAHMWQPVTADNINDYEFMFKTFHDTKKILENNGLKVRGIIKGGSSSAVPGGKNSEYGNLLQAWASAFYEYSDEYGNGYSPDFYKVRTNLSKRTVDNIKGLIDTAITNKTFLPLYFHRLVDTDITQSNFETILDYCLEKKTAGTLDIVTYSTLYDKFKSTRLEKRLTVLESK